MNRSSLWSTVDALPIEAPKWVDKQKRMRQKKREKEGNQRGLYSAFTREV